jgi:hypothetical protein
VGTMVNFLTAKVPKVQPNWAFETLQFKGHFAELDAMGARHAGVELLHAQPAAQLGLARSCVAQEQDLDLRVVLLSRLEVFVMSADFIQNIFKGGRTTDFRRQILQLTAKQAEVFQRGQQRFELAKPANTAGGAQDIDVRLFGEVALGVGKTTLVDSILLILRAKNWRHALNDWIICVVLNGRVIPQPVFEQFKRVFWAFSLYNRHLRPVVAVRHMQSKMPGPPTVLE